MSEIDPDAVERAARRAAYQDRERRRATAAMDRYLELLYGSGIQSPAEQVAGERFVEAVGDYVLSRLQHTADYGASDGAGYPQGVDGERFPDVDLVERERFRP